MRRREQVSVCYVAGLPIDTLADRILQVRGEMFSEKMVWTRLLKSERMRCLVYVGLLEKLALTRVKRTVVLWM